MGLNEDAFRKAFDLDKPKENPENTNDDTKVDEKVDEPTDDTKVDEKKDNPVDDDKKTDEPEDNKDKKPEEVDDPASKEKVLPNNEDDKTDSVGFEKLLAEKSGGKFKSYADIERALEEAPQDAFANETVAKLNDYVKGGGNPDDFLRTQTVDYSQMDDVQLVKEHMKMTKKGLSNDDVDFLIQSKYGVSKDASESDKRLAKIELKSAANEAMESLLENQKQWSVPQGKVSPEDVQKEVERWESNLSDTAKSFDKLNVDLGDGSFEYDVSDEDKASLVEQNKDLRQFFKRYQNEDGTENTQKFVQDMYILNNWQKIAKALAVHAKGKGTEDIVDEIKNPDYKGTDDKKNTDGKNSLIEQVGKQLFGG